MAADVTPDVSPSPSPSPTPSPSPSPSAAGPAGGSPSPTPSPSPSFSYPEDRGRWVPPDRLTAAERATNLAAQRAQQLERELETERNRVRSLAGLAPQDPDAAELEKVRAGFAQLYPNLARMAAIDPEQLERVLAAGQQAEHVVRTQWDRHRDSTLDEIKASVAHALNLDKLSESAARKVVAAFKASVPDPEYDRSNRPTNPEYHRWVQRYEAKDPTLLTEFVSEFVGDFITPAQRSGFIRQRVAVPSGGASRPVATNPTQRPDYGKMKSVAEMLEAAEKEVDAHYGA